VEAVTTLLLSKQVVLVAEVMEPLVLELLQQTEPQIQVAVVVVVLLLLLEALVVAV
jgi:hypothetical protein